MGFGQTSLPGVRRGFMPPQLKTNKNNNNNKILTPVYIASHPEISS
jgi:hypothetical protein